ncbi:MAG: hypothetical protein ABMB14_10270 [Myxococcota bacterium]
MRRWWLASLVVAWGCGGQPFCGVDDVGNDIPSCKFEVEGLPEALEFCPGDQWASPACESCACLPTGGVQCTDPAPSCDATTTAGGE